ncbi:MAG TPA: translocation/assembly module TamB domain-containing protein, partial [Candidatus Omnitrophota bacterium]|nr:translocation/assembly module TamB domain-containing protein [Candidatus Omnitrophota bacterium]
PVVAVDLTGAGVGFAAAARAGIGRLSVELDGRWADGRIEGSATARDRDVLRLAASGSAMLEGDGALAGRVELTGDVARITEALPLAGHVFAGRIDGAADVGGTLARPRLDGQARLDGGRYENLEFGTLVTGLEADIAIDGDTATITAQGGDGRDGRVALDGQVVLAGEPRWQGDISLDRFRAVRRDDVRARLSADLAFAGQGERGRLSGDAEISRADVDISRLQGGGPVTLDVIEVNRPGPSPQRKRDPAEAPAPLTIALAIDLDVDRAFVRGRGLDSDWSGKVQVAGTLDAPTLTGRLSPDRGRYEFLGRAFDLSKDSGVVFDGGLSPRLDVTAEADAGDVQARVVLTGTVEAPQVDITSDPPLPRDEVLSRVLFGEEPGQLSVFQQIQLGQLAAGGLTGNGGGFDPIGKVRGALGLDVLEVGSSDDQTADADDNGGGPTLSAGKYIGDNTFLRVEQGTDGVGSVTVERELGAGLSITTELGQQSGGGVGVEWRRNY